MPAINRHAPSPDAPDSSSGTAAAQWPASMWFEGILEQLWAADCWPQRTLIPRSKLCVVVLSGLPGRSSVSCRPAAICL